MRKGTNPAKLNDIKVENDCFHQVVLPVYLPKLEGYYKEGLDILELCLESIYLTVHDKTFISVVNNGSCKEVRDYLDNLMHDGKIQEVIHTTAIGKINAIAKGLAGHHFELVTITDADVLFTNGWQKAVYDIYETFPKAGMVGTTPNPLAINKFTEKIYIDNFFNKSLKFYNIQIKTGDDIDSFFKSIGWKGVKSSLHKKKGFGIQKDNVKAMIGTGHFTATYKRNLLCKFNKNEISLDKISSQSDSDYLDKPSVKKGHWRLATFSNYTYHMGNHIESWMHEKFSEIIKEENKMHVSLPKIKLLNNKYLVYLVNRFFFKTVFFKKFLKTRGLSDSQVKDFLL
jgi:hypothetical protein